MIMFISTSIHWINRPIRTTQPGILFLTDSVMKCLSICYFFFVVVVVIHVMLLSCLSIPLIYSMSNIWGSCISIIIITTTIKKVFIIIYIFSLLLPLLFSCIAISSLHFYTQILCMYLSQMLISIRIHSFISTYATTTTKTTTRTPNTSTTTTTMQHKSIWSCSIQ